MPHRFRIDPWLEAESVQVGDLPLCAVLLRDDRRFPWLVLVPRQPGLVEIFDLSAPDRTRLIEEIALASRILQAATNCQKLNTAALGIIVHQLHVHVSPASPTTSPASARYGAPASACPTRPQRATRS